MKKGLFLVPRSEEIERILQRLMRYPVAEVPREIARNLSKYKCIRRLITDKRIGIAKVKRANFIFLTENTHLEKKGKKYFIRIP